LDEIQLDLELGRILAERDDVEPRECDVCGSWTYTTRCPVCPGRPALSRLERLMVQQAAGDDVSFAEIINASLGNGVKQDA